MVVYYCGLAVAMGDGAGQLGLCPVLRHHVPGREGQEVDHIHARLVFLIRTSRTTHQGTVFPTRLCQMTKRDNG